MEIRGSPEDTLGERQVARRKLESISAHFVVSRAPLSPHESQQQDGCQAADPLGKTV